MTYQTNIDKKVLIPSSLLHDSLISVNSWQSEQRTWLVMYLLKYSSIYRTLNLKHLVPIPFQHRR